MPAFGQFAGPVSHLDVPHAAAIAHHFPLEHRVNPFRGLGVEVSNHGLKGRLKR